MPSEEFSFIRQIRQQHTPAEHVLTGIGDDTAVLRPPRSPLLITTDIITEGVDFLLDSATPRQVGRKAMAVNLSDIAAMAGRPIAAVVGLVVPRSGNPTLIHELNAGLHEVAERFQVPIVGGDTNSWEGGLVVSVTVLGESEKPILRSGAQPGDALFVTGTLGGSILGRHLDPQPRISEALQLRSLVPLHALIDISDGLSQDLGHILSESGCGAILDAEAIPIHPDATTLSQTSGKSPLEHALGDGEDFELILAVSPEDAERLTAQPVPGITLSRIGTCVREPGMWLQESGKLVPLMPRGWNHPLS